MKRLDVMRQPGFGAISVMLLAFLYVPLIVLVVLSFNSGQLFHRWEGFSLYWYQTALSDQGFRRAALTSLMIATSAAILATAAATLAALALESGKRSGNGFSASVIDLPLVLPEIVMAVGVLAMLAFLRSLSGWDPGILALILTHTMFCIPFALGPIRARLRRLDPGLAQAAADLHASPFRIATRITMPLLMPAIASGAALAFIVSFDDFAISQLVAGPGETTLPVFIWAQLRRPLTPEVNAMCVIVLGASLCFICLSAVLTRVRSIQTKD